MKVGAKKVRFRGSLQKRLLVGALSTIIGCAVIFAAVNTYAMNTHLNINAPAPSVPVTAPPPSESVPSTQNEERKERQIAYSDYHYWRSPSSVLPPKEKYVTFEPWGGGFNNIRMSLEQAAAFAFAQGRTLVLPPEYNMYLRGQSSLQDYFDLDHLKAGLSVLTYEEFAARIDLKSTTPCQKRIPFQV